MNNLVPPHLILIAGALFVPFLRGKLQKALLLILPVLAFVAYLRMPEGVYWTLQVVDFKLIFGSVDRLSLIFVSVFTLVTFISVLFNLKAESNLEHFAGLLYAGSAIGTVLAGDLITLFIFWELLTIGSVLLVLSPKQKDSVGAALRYLLVHAAGGLILLAGIVLHIVETGSSEFTVIGLSGLSSYLIFIGFGINCAWPLLHAWLPDAYPAASPGGVIFMATFTTKTAVYVLMRSFPGEPALIWIGVAMATFPIFYAVLENDLRRVLAYSLINQVGFMVVGIGVGTAMALNGSAAHVYSDILFKSLLFMSIGAVMYRTGGKSKATELGGLFRSMPLTGIFCMIGAASISAFPLFSGFVSKSMIMSAAAEHDYFIVWIALLFASAGVFHHAGIKIPFFTFFSHDSGIRVKEAPINMLLAMGITATLCLVIGIFPHQTLYRLLPYAMEHAYEPYTFAHVNGQFMLLLFSALAFTLLLLSGIYPSEIRSINVDADWFYRRGARHFYTIMDKGLNGINALAERTLVKGFVGSVCQFMTNAAASLSLLILVPAWKFSGANTDEVETRSSAFKETLGKGTSPVGYAAGLVLLTMSILVIVSLIQVSGKV